MLSRILPLFQLLPWCPSDFRKKTYICPSFQYVIIAHYYLNFLQYVITAHYYLNFFQMPHDQIEYIWRFIQLCVTALCYGYDDGWHSDAKQLWAQLPRKVTGLMKYHWSWHCWLVSANAQVENKNCPTVALLCSELLYSQQQIFHPKTIFMTNVCRAT